MRHLEDPSEWHDRSLLPQNSGECNAKNVKLPPITNLLVDFPPRRRSVFCEWGNTYEFSSAVQRRETDSFSPFLKGQPVSPPFEPDMAKRMIGDLNPQPGYPSQCSLQRSLVPAEEPTRNSSTDIHGLNDGPTTHADCPKENIPTTARCSPRRLSRQSNSSPNSTAGPSSRISKRRPSLATRDGKRAAQNAAHTAMEQQRRLRTTKGIETIAKLIGAEGTKVEVLEKNVEWIKCVRNLIANIADLSALEGSEVQVLERNVKWIKHISEAIEIIANLIGVDGSDVEILESVVKWMIQARTERAELKATVSDLTSRLRALDTGST